MMLHRRVVMAAAVVCLIGLSAAPGMAQSKQKFPWENTHQPIQQRVHELVSRMCGASSTQGRMI
ncbi:MAG: hypothetical protein ACP5M4_14210 [Acidobacteriaceae bacterium]